MTVTDLISFALLACASWRLVDATRTLRRVEAMHADADRRLNAAAEYAEQVHRNAAHLARIMHPSTQPAITAPKSNVHRAIEANKAKFEALCAGFEEEM